MLREEFRVGRQYLDEVTLLLQRIRAADPTAGLFEAADLQWWWRMPRRTDDMPQIFWMDDDGRPTAAAIATAWSERAALDPFVMPGAAPDWIRHVMERGLTHAAECGIETVELEVDSADEVLRAVLDHRGFIEDGQGGSVESWLPAGSRPAISPLHDGYRLSNRADTKDRQHHMIGRSHPDVEERLQQTSLYRPDLDLVVHDAAGSVAAYGLFWYDPVTSTGLVEPMRTEEDHQRRGLARHVLTTGLDLLAGAGAERIKIVYEPGNPASGPLYRSVGFEPVRTTVLLTGPTAG